MQVEGLECCGRRFLSEYILIFFNRRYDWILVRANGRGGNPKWRRRRKVVLRRVILERFVCAPAGAGGRVFVFSLECCCVLKFGWVWEWESNVEARTYMLDILAGLDAPGPLPAGFYYVLGRDARPVSPDLLSRALSTWRKPEQ